MRIGHGYDVHSLVEGRELILGGVCIPHTHGLLGYSDADAALHAICDAILGALALGDIGHYFPDTDSRFEGADSRDLMRQVAVMMQTKGYQIANLDLTIVAQAPKLAPHIQEMRENIAGDLGAALDQINVKATTTEKLGFVGKQQGIEAHAVVLLETLVQ